MNNREEKTKQLIEELIKSIGDKIAIKQEIEGALLHLKLINNCMKYTFVLFIIGLLFGMSMVGYIIIGITFGLLHLRKTYLIGYCGVLINEIKKGY